MSTQCACGCGKLINAFDKQKRPRRFVNGHNRPFKKGSENIGWKGGSFIDKYGYRWIRKPEHPHNENGYVLEHRLVMEKYLGRYLQTKELVHHINHDRVDNRLDNLHLTNRAAHFKLHRLMAPDVDMSDRVCIECNSNKTWQVYKNGRKSWRWLRHPVTKQQWVCGRCWQKIKRNLP